MIVKINECIFFIEVDYVLEKYIAIWNNVSTDIEKDFDSKSVYNKKI